MPQCPHSQRQKAQPNSTLSWTAPLAPTVLVLPLLLRSSMTIKTLIEALERVGGEHAYSLEVYTNGEPLCPLLASPKSKSRTRRLRRLSGTPSRRGDTSCSEDPEAPMAHGSFQSVDVS